MFLSLKNWLTGNMGIAGEYQYTTNYWITLACVIFALIFCVFLGSTTKITDKNKRIILKSIAIFQLSFEILWRLIYLFVKKDNILCWWPTYPCNVGGIILPIIALTNSKLGKKMFYLFGFIGACLTFAIPEGIFSNSVMVFPIVKSILQHTGLLLIPAFEFASKTFRPTIKYYGFVILGCFVHLLNCEVIDRLLGFTDDYMFLRGDMPFVIEGVPQFITVSVFALIVIALLSFLCDIKGSIAYLCKKNKTKEA